MREVRERRQAPCPPWQRGALLARRWPVLLLLFAWLPLATAAPAVALNESERAYLQAHPTPTGGRSS